MRIWSSWAGVLIFTATALLAIPTLAAARPGYVTFPGHHEVELKLRGSHGYSIQVSAVDRRWTEMFANKEDSVVVYLIRHARARGNGIEVRFPGIGRISVRFHPTGHPHREDGFFPPCEGGQTVKQPGYFEGTIHLRGERGYTTADASRAKGQATTARKEVCKRSIFNPSKPEPEESRTYLFASSKAKGRTVGFSATTLGLPPLGLTFFEGYLAEHREGMVIFREAFTNKGKGDDFAPSDSRDHPLSATVTPPSPFHGSAAFQRNPGGDNAWTGSLSVDLPGAGQISLAGSDFDATLCNDSGCPVNRSAFAGRASARPRASTPPATSCSCRCTASRFELRQSEAGASGLLIPGWIPRPIVCSSTIFCR